VPITWSLEDGEETQLPNNSTLIQSQRQSDLNSGRTMVWKFKAMEEAQTLE
jgi:hypothetical protein